jgi:hypothetical protein
METINSIPFAGKTVTMSFYARAGANYSAASNALNVYLISGTGTDQSRGSGNAYTGEAFPINAQTATLTTTWQRFTFTGTVGATATELAFYSFYTPSGTAGANDYFEMTGCQIDIGSVALPFRTYAATIQGELAACQRYYREVQFATGIAVSTTSCQIWVTHTGMRVAPSSAASAAIKVTNATTADYTQSVAGVSVTANVADGGRYSSGNFTGMTVGAAANVVNGGGTIQLSAEL